MFIVKTCMTGRESAVIIADTVQTTIYSCGNRLGFREVVVDLRAVCEQYHQHPQMQQNLRQ